MNVSIVIPAHNEQARIEKTIRAYHRFFQSKNHTSLNVEFVIALNGCTDNTYQIVTSLKKDITNLVIVDLKESGKGLAVKHGFLNALERNNDYIGFVDADMATRPEYFYDLMKHICTNSYDGVIASRYMPESIVVPPRPRIKRWGSRIFYETLVFSLLGLSYYDLQCGAKIFTRLVIESIALKLKITHFAADVELLYLCKLYGFTVKEIPTVWYDDVQHSKLKLSAGFHMIGSVVALRARYSPFTFSSKK